MREMYGFLRLASRLANPFGHHFASPYAIVKSKIILLLCTCHVDAQHGQDWDLDFRRHHVT